MNNNLDPDTLKIPAFLRKKTIVSQARQKLILTALDRKDAGLSPNSHKALAPVKSAVSSKSVSRQKISGIRTVRSAAPGLKFATTSRLGGNFFPQPHLLTAENAAATLTKNKTFPCIGEVTHYLDKISVAIIMLSSPLKENDTVLIQGEDAVFVQQVTEMQIDRKPVAKAKKGSHIGLKVDKPAEINGKVYRFG